MVVNRSALVPRTQRKKLELNPSYGYGAMSKNASICAHACAFGAYPHIFDFKGGSRYFQMHDRKNRCIFEIFSFANFAYFCDKHPISFEDNTFSQIFIFHTALIFSKYGLLSLTCNVIYIKGR